MKILAIGMNYPLHIKEMQNILSPEMVIFSKPESALLLDNKPFFYPDFSADIQYETEIVIKIDRLGKKAIIKITDKFFDNDEVNKIALVAPEAKLNTIRDYRVVEKREVKVPDEVTGIAKCVNPKCITNNERITTRFYVTDKKPVTLKCHYCEKMVEQEQMTIL